MYGFKGIRSGKTEVLLHTNGLHKGKQSHCFVYFAAFADAEAAMKTLLAENITCRFADGVAEQLDADLTGDI